MFPNDATNYRPISLVINKKPRQLMNCKYGRSNRSAAAKQDDEGNEDDEILPSIKSVISCLPCTIFFFSTRVYTSLSAHLEVHYGSRR